MTLGLTRIAGGTPQRRLVALVVLLVLSLGVGVGLAVQSIQTARRHRATAERALDDYAGFGAFILASQTYRQLGGAVVSSFASWIGPRGPATLPDGIDCPAGNTRFETPPGGGAPRYAGPGLGARDAAFLVDTLRFAMPLLEEVGWRFRFIRANAPPIDGFFVTSYRAANGKYGLRGFAVCLGGDDSPFRQVMLAERALPPAVTGTLPADSLYSISVRSGEGQPLYQSPRAYQSPYQGSARLGTEFGDLTLSLSLRPGVTNRLVIGGIPASPTPLVIGLLGLSALFIVTALVQLRREYELITIRSEFVSNVSHELRTPLSQILLFTELLKLGRLRSSAERERALHIIDQETRRLIRLVENVLQFSGAARGTRRLAGETLPLGDVIRETVDAFRPLADAREATLLIDVPAQAAVRGDRSALRQILLNLLDNAIKYGPRGQTVSVAAAAMNGTTRIVVDDQGPGIPLEDRERVWDGYYRLGREANSAVAGSGIGLAVVRSVVRDLGGRTWIEDTETGGARFIVELATAEGGHS